MNLVKIYQLELIILMNLQLLMNKMGKPKKIVIPGGNLDIGLRDTMKDLIVNFIGAIVFSIIGLLYIKNRDEYKFAENFIPTMKVETNKSEE